MAILTQISLLDTIRKHVRDLKQMGVASLGLFGSFARGEETESSDIDILVDFSPGRKTFDNFMDVKFFLERLLQRKVDLVTLNALKPAFKSEILKSIIYVENF